MSWKTAWRSFYYETAEEPEDIVLEAPRTALLVIDIQNTYLELPDDPTEAARWAPFFERMHETVIPNTAALQKWARMNGIEVIHARIACERPVGRRPPHCL